MISLVGSNNNSWTYDDILLEPAQTSDVSWKNVDLKTDIVGDLKIDVPIVMAPMMAIQNIELFEEMQKIGIMPWIHRYQSVAEQVAITKKLCESSYNKYVAIAINTEESEYIKIIESIGEAVNGKFIIVKIDVANGASRRALKTIETIAKKYQTQIYIFSGNVCTVEGAVHVVNSGADGVMVGVGGGSVCTTREQTGIGRGNGEALYEIMKYIRIYAPRKKVVADGGFRKPADIVKALAIGANACMSGKFFITSDKYYGMSSKTALEAYGKTGRHSFEGACVNTASHTIDAIKEHMIGTIDSIKSACSYLNVNNMHELCHKEHKARFITNAVKIESGVHINI